MRAVVTGGAGFIGSHLADALLAEGNEVFVMDNLSGGLRENVNEKAVFMKRDIRQDLSNELSGMDAVFHFAGIPDVRSCAADPAGCFDVNVSGTVALLESCRRADVQEFVLASTSAVYGDAAVMPTPESHPCAPISLYGAGKLACEGHLCAYASAYGMKGTSVRMANIFGERSRHGVIHDFFMKLGKNPRTLEILGDGSQEKSYLHVSDCVPAILAAAGRRGGGYDVFNAGSDASLSVKAIAEKICRELKLSPSLVFTGTKRGWSGDTRAMLLDTAKLKALGWSARTPFDVGLAGYLSSLPP